MELGLAGKVVYVAGSSRGIGLGISRAFLAEGSSVVLVARTARTLEVARATLASSFGSGRVLVCAGDLADAAFCERSLSEAVERFGGLDVLVANVGGGTDVAGWNVPAAEFDRVFTQNFSISQRLAQAAVPRLLGRLGASLIFVSSVAGVEVVGAPLSYTAAKSAVASYAKALSRALGPEGVRVNVVAPGNVLFAGGRWERRLAEGGDALLETIRRDVPLGRFGTPEEVAAAVVFLASAPASFITGSCLLVDGGQSHAI